MALVDSLLTAMVRANGDALVLHVGERPYVVTQAGPIDLSTHGLNLQAMKGMLAQLIPAEGQQALTEVGAVEHQLAPIGADQFTVVAARGGDDIWIEIRRRRGKAAAAVAPPSAPPEAQALPAMQTPLPAPRPAAVSPAPEPVAEPVHAPVPALEPVAAAFAEPERHAPPTPMPEPPMPEPVPPRREPVVAAAPAAAVTMAAPIIEPVIEAPRPVIEARVEPAPPVESLPPPVAMPAAPPTVVPPAPPAPPAAQVPVAPIADVAAVRPVAPPPAAPRPAPPQASPAEPDENVVAPLTRTVRIEVPSRTVSTRPSVVERLLRLAVARGASALFLASQARPYVRIDGDMRLLEGEPALSAADVEAAVLEVLPESSRDAVRRAEPVEWLAEMGDLGRIRCVSFRDQRGPGALFRLVGSRVATVEQLGLPPELQALATESEGLVVIAGPRSSGKSTLLSSFVDVINRQRADYVVMLEREPHLLHENRKALISQREVRGGAEHALAAAHAALREGPDVFVLDDLMAPEMLSPILEAAGQGSLVLMSMTAASAVEAVQRLVDMAPPDRRASARAALAGTFRGAVAQVLIRKSAGGRMAARELLLGTGPVARVITDGPLHELNQELESGRKQGMAPLTDALVGYVQSGVVDVREAYRKTGDRERLLAGLRREGIDTSLVERLA